MLNTPDVISPFAVLACPGDAPDKAAAARAEVAEYLGELREEYPRDKNAPAAYLRERARRTAAACGTRARAGGPKDRPR